MLTSHFYPSVGGVERHALELAQKLSDESVHVTVVTSRLSSGAKSERFQGFEVQRLRPFAQLRKGIALPSVLPSLIRERFDLVHVQAPFHSGLESATLYRILFRSPLVVTCQMYRGTASLFSRVYDDFVYDPCLRLADRIIVTSQDYVMRHKIFAKLRRNIRLVPNGIDLDRFVSIGRDAVAHVRAKYSLGNSPIVLFVGSLENYHYYKRVDLLIKAFRIIITEIPELKLLIVGSGSLIPWLKEQAGGLGESALFLEDVTGYESWDVLGGLYKAADIFVLPSVGRAEAFSLVSLEAMASGTPVVASNLEGVREVLGDGAALVEPGNIEALSQMVMRVLTDTALRRRLRERGLDLVRRKYSWQAVLPRILSVYEEALASR